MTPISFACTDTPIFVLMNKPSNLFRSDMMSIKQYNRLESQYVGDTEKIPSTQQLCFSLLKFGTTARLNFWQSNNIVYERRIGYYF